MTYREAVEQEAKTYPKTVFRVACELAGLPLTRRQWSKWVKRRGAAHRRRAEAVDAVMNPKIA